MSGRSGDDHGASEDTSYHYSDHDAQSEDRITSLKYGSGSNPDDARPENEFPRSQDEDDNQPFALRVYAMMSHAPTRRALGLGCGLMVVQQCSGINTVMYYAASIYAMAGFPESTAVWLSGFTALAQVFGIALSIILVDKLGRRTLVLYSLGFVTLSLIGLGTSFLWSRQYSGDVLKADDQCLYQPAKVWDGITAFCYDCTTIPGCGYCGNVCTVGDERGPFTMDACPGTLSDGEDSSSSWFYEGCLNPYGSMSVFFMVLYLFTFGIGTCVVSMYIHTYDISVYLFLSAELSSDTPMHIIYIL